MQPSLLKKLKFLLILVLLFSFKVGSAQVKYDAISFRIDSLAAMGLPKSALAEVDKLERLARENNNAPQQIRAVVYRMTFESYLEQDALTAIINRLKLDIAQSTYPVKPVLQSLLGEMYWKYYQQYRYQYARRSRLLKPDTDFTKWDLQTIITETSHQYELSLHDAERAQTTPISVLDGVLAGDSSTRYLRPTLYDLLLQRALSFYLEDEPALTRPKLPFSPNDPALFADSRTFADLPVKTTDTASTYYVGLKFLQQGTAFHLKMNQQEAVADLDMQRLKFLFGKSHAEQKDSLYLAALRGIALSFAQKPISSEALVLQGQYYSNLDSLVTAYNYYKQALTAYPESQGGQNAATLIREIEVKEIAATVEEVNAPGKPLLALLNYRNITQANFTVYHLSEAQLGNYLAGYKSYYTKDSRLDFLKKLKPVQSRELKLTDLKDFRKHSAEFKIDALLPGNYVLLVKENATSDETQTGLANFRVSRIAYTARENPDEKTEFRVMDRETGAPLSGVKILLSGKRNRYDTNYKTSYTEDIVDNGTSDKNGFFITDKFGGNNQMSMGLRIKGDTLNEGQRYIAGAMDNSDDEDDPEDKTILFTDRQIYRPGQTIYFKGLQLQTFKGKSKILPDKTLTVEFLDVNNKQVSSVALKTNDFGTLCGSFIIPQNMLDGNVTIKTVVGEISVKVEEYKRPTFQVAFLPLKESNKLNDSVTIRGTVLAFSGYGLSRAKVAYHITRSENFDYYNYNRHVHTNRYNYNRQTAEIKTDTTTTDDRGNYIIKFKAIPGEADKAYVINYRYDITADVTDASGETHTGETSVNVGNNDIKIVGYLPAQLLAKDSIRLPLSINNLNGQEQKGDIKVEVYALQNPGQLFKNKLWSKPDTYLLSKADFKEDFREYAYGDEDEASAWKRLNQIEDLDFKVDENKPGVLKLDELRQQPSGIYQVIMRAKNEKGDTTSTTSYVDLVNEASKPANVTDWV
ncbi:MAG TPA: MG2 domain-containing protein, partial [Mucilaginibacter sp.]|nr:MG2 domain-containing protein [Mucilaginibacter sp.]